jgi:hypothetical protein
LASATASIVNILKKTITSAQILNSNSVPVTLIPAPGAGKVIFVQSAIFKYVYGSSVYTTNTTTNIRLGAFTLWTSGTAIQGGTDYVNFVNMIPTSTVGSSLPENQPILFNTSTGNPTGGDGTIDLYITYITITL